MSTITNVDKKEKQRERYLRWYSKHKNDQELIDDRKIRLSEYRIKNRERLIEKNRRLRRNRLDNGKCSQCNAVRIPESKVRCERHWFAGVAGDHFGNYGVKLGEKLKRMMEDQEYKCPYTGKAIKPGHAHLDHKLPKSRFPELSNDLSNLQWVAPEVNLSKANLTHDEFIAMCKLIAKRFSDENT